MFLSKWVVEIHSVVSKNYVGAKVLAVTICSFFHLSTSQLQTPTFLTQLFNSGQGSAAPWTIAYLNDMPLPLQANPIFLFELSNKELLIQAHFSRARIARPMIQSLSSSDRKSNSSVKCVIR
jgi:hypothetical protein